MKKRRVWTIKVEGLEKSGAFKVEHSRTDPIRTFSTTTPIFVPSQNPTFVERVGDTVIGKFNALMELGHPKKIK